MRGAKLRIFTIDGKIIDIPVKTIKKLLFFGDIDFMVENAEHKKVLIPKSNTPYLNHNQKINNITKKGE